MTEDELFALVKRVDPRAVRLPPGIKAIADEIERVTTETACENAERRGHSRGYQAGLRRKKQEDRERQVQQQEAAFWNRAFLAALTECISTQGWTRGKDPISDIPSRTKLAVGFANEALKYFRSER